MQEWGITQNICLPPETLKCCLGLFLCKPPKKNLFKMKNKKPPQNGTDRQNCNDPLVELESVKETVILMGYLLTLLLQIQSACAYGDFC